MSLLQPPCPFTLPRRGRIAEIDFDITDALFEEYGMAANIRLARGRSSTPDHEHCPSDDDSASDSSVEDNAMEDPDYIPPRAKIWSVASLKGDHPHTLRSRPTQDTIKMSPFPDTFERAHLTALNFRFFKWHDQPGALVDLRDRIGAMYFGSPVESLEWQRAIIQAGHDMLDARICASEEGKFEVDVLSSGICSDGYLGYRPQSMRGNRAVSGVDVALATLRHSPAIQTVASFQNAVLQKVAPRVWTSAKEIIETVMQHDSRLRLPFDMPNSHTAREPTAFSRIDYCFATDGTPRRQGSSYVPGMSALTALGNYDATEGEIILWAEKAVINFPPGATMLLPRWMPYSFTAVESPGYQLILSQTCEHGLSEFIANDFSGVYGEEVQDVPRLLQDAGAAASLAASRAAAHHWSLALATLPANHNLNAGISTTQPLVVDENGVILNHPGFGTTPATPYIVDENGRVVNTLESPRRPRRRLPRKPKVNPSGARGTRHIIGGPPSEIPRTTRSRAARDEANDGPYRQLAAAAHIFQAPSLAASSTSTTSTASSSTTVSSSSTSISTASSSTTSTSMTSRFGSGTTRRLPTLRTARPPVGTRTSLTGFVPAGPLPVPGPNLLVLEIMKRDGYRAPRPTPFNVNNLYLTDARPPTDHAAVDPDFRCVICLGIKSHPVVYPCGHCDCYVCIREWLEQSWQCPQCRAPMTSEPIADNDVALVIARNHPSWHDLSSVNYTWTGLLFPSA
ncbi:hypothetical protein C8F04DRAFT_1274600 [Mycena alexandri]|uniref:RING-type E3 ubiquitin transferase n=1 Tax=Mycena alexandri TaxID=1745969 RepID=A0AAD6S3Y5_9AGAR|nr:hypothetical protein C8F04DRAFT_1274600 [Mycena alexandri]